ncbi:MAG: glycosyltransferase [Ignavibacteriaceae bacterium]
MKILIITPRIPYPPFRGDKLKIYNIAKNLSCNNSVHILTFHRNKKQLDDLKNFEKLGIKIETVKLPVIESIFWTFAAIFSKLPFQAALYRSVKMKKKVNMLVNNGSFDVIYYHWIRIAQYFDATESKGKTLSVVDYTDAVSLNLSRLAGIERNPFKKFSIQMEQKRIAVHEKIAEKFHTLFICSEVDKKYLQERGIKANYRLLYNGVDTKYFQSDSTQYDWNRIIFTGNMPYRANYDAVLYFADEIFPKILNVIPEAKFYVVGQKPPQKIIRLASKNIVVTGFVPEIQKEYLMSAVSVAPTRFGAGTLNKVLESIALGVPVVATSIAVIGLPSQLKKFVFVADKPEEFANSVIKIISDPAIRNDLMHEGQKIIKEEFSWEVIVRNFENYLISETTKSKKMV